MANEQNLIPGGHKLTLEEQSKGGIASGKARRERKTLKEELLLLLSENITDKRGNTATAQKAVSSALLKKAMTGDTRAFEIIRDTIGEKPVDKVEMKTDVNIEESTARLKSLFDGIAKNDG